MPKAIGNRKTCGRCRVESDLSNYQKNRSQPDGLHNYCRLCCSEMNREWRTANPEKKLAQRLRANPGQHLKRYGMTQESYEAMLATQGGCAICHATEPGSGRAYYAVDHDHRCCPQRMSSCGACVRGLLCHRCNTGIGLLRDSVENLHAAIVYLTR